VTADILFLYVQKWEIGASIPLGFQLNTFLLLPFIGRWIILLQSCTHEDSNGSCVWHCVNWSELTLTVVVEQLRIAAAAE